jgi:hypothetical protein
MTLTTLPPMVIDRAMSPNSPEIEPLYDPEQHRSHSLLYGGHDPGTCARCLGAMKDPASGPALGG